MKLSKIAVFCVIAASLSGCAAGTGAGGNTVFGASGATKQAAPVARDYAVRSIRFSIPEDLKVSEANSYYPIADIVWRGDPAGNRKDQISAIFQSSIEAAGNTLSGSRPVVVDVQLARFHSLTERTRYSFGGVHSIKFDLTVLDAATGAVVEPTRRINGDVNALGGQRAVDDDFNGIGPKVRVTAHLTNLFFRELSGTNGNIVTVGANN